MCMCVQVLNVVARTATLLDALVAAVKVKQDDAGGPSPLNHTQGPSHAPSAHPTHSAPPHDCHVTHARRVHAAMSSGGVCVTVAGHGQQQQQQHQ